MSPTSSRSTTSGVHNNPSRSPTPTINTRKSTRKSTLEPSKSKDAIAAISKYKVSDATSGAAYLNKTLLSLVGEPFTSEHLATTLLHISQMDKMPLAAIEAIRAVAFLLEEESVSKTTSTSLKMNLENVKQMHENLPSSVDTILTRLEEVKTSIMILKPSLDTTQFCLDSFISKTAQEPVPPPRSYSDITRTSPPISTQNHAALARAAVRARQILFDPSPGQTLYSPTSPPAEVASRLNEAILSLRTEESPITTIKAILRLRNGGLLAEVNSEEAASWIKSKYIREKLITTLGIQANIKDRLYSIVVPYLPITSRTDSPSFLRTIEEENNLATGAINTIRWIKPIERRNPNQKVAHAILTTSDPMVANTLLKDGLYVNREKLYPRKNKREPTCCVCCQLWGHIARNCKAEHDTCGTCGEHHHTSSCNKTDKLYCTGCKTKNHASYSRNCQEFIKRSAELDAKYPENNMPYFPTNEEWMQVSQLP
ncbi:hypothetical protein BU15DRAFT_52371, partial [Melanogaster broomeanus]